jgi:hypothetical protein
MIYDIYVNILALQYLAYLWLLFFAIKSARTSEVPKGLRQDFYRALRSGKPTDPVPLQG